MSLLRLTAEVLLLLGASFAILLWAGFGPAWLLRTWRLRPYLPLFTPILGLASLIAVGHALALLPIGTDAIAIPVLGLFGVLNVWCWRKGARPRLPKRLAWLLVPVAVALVLAVLPLFDIGYLTTVGGGVDAVTYVARAEALQSYGLLRAPMPKSGDPMGQLFVGMMATGVRQGDQFFLALVSSVVRLRPHLVFPVLMAVWYGLICMGVVLLARQALRLPRIVAAGSGLLVAVQPLLHFVILAVFFSQAAGIAAATFTISALLLAGSTRSRRAAVFGGLLVATLTALYQAYLPYVIAIAALPVLAPLWRRAVRHRWRAFATRAWRLAETGHFAVLLMPAAWVLAYRAWVFLKNVVGTRGAIAPGARGDISVFPHLGETIGLVNHYRATFGGKLPVLDDRLASLLLLPAALLALYGLLRATGRKRWFLGVTLAVLSAAILQARFLLDAGHGYPYGYFKLVSLASPFIVLQVANGVWQAWRDARRLTRWSASAIRIGVGAYASTLALFGLTNLLSTIPEVNRRALVASKERIEVAVAARLVPPGEPLLIADPTHCGRGWAVYLMRHTPVFDRGTYAVYAAPSEAYAERLPRYALLFRDSGDERFPGDPWWRADRREVLWRNELYELVRRRDSVVGDVPLFRSDLRLGLDSAVWIGLGSHLTIIGGVGQGTGYRQVLSGACARLEITLDAQRATLLPVSGRGGRTSTALREGRNTITVAGGSESWTLGPAVGVEIRQVRALSGGPS